MLSRVRALALLVVASLVALGALPPAADAATLRLVLAADSPKPGAVLHLAVTVSPARGLSSGTATVRFSTGSVTVHLIRSTSTRLKAGVRVPAKAHAGRVTVVLHVRTTAGVSLAASKSVVITSPLPTATPSPSASASSSPKPTTTPSPSPTSSASASPSSSPTSPPAGSPQIGGCPVFPASNVWNKPVTSLPVASNSSTLITSIGASTGLHPDFGSYLGYGIPYNLANASTPRYTFAFDYDTQSDAGPYPIPANPAIEDGSDAHLLVVDTSSCTLYETFATATDGHGHWTGGSGAIWSLTSNALRPDGWTSADAAGLPILAGLVRYDEVAAGFIGHAIRFTAVKTRAAHIYPARHDASDLTSSSYPPMGLRVRMKASYDISKLPAQAKVIAQAMKTYGMILADNGSNWYFQGASDPAFDDDQLNALKAIPGSAFEVVDTTGFVSGP
ncbi:MAG: hypothetical protein U0838_06780 [Chloroflexota bacterium]